MAQTTAATKDEKLATRTVVINNKEALIMAQMPHGGKDTSGALMVGEVVSFIPGVNLIDTEKLATLRKNAAFEANFTTPIEASLAPEQNPEKVGRMILVKGEELPLASPLANLKPKAVEALVGETFSVELLSKWRDDSGDLTTRAVIQNQIDKLRGGSTKGGPAASGR